MAQYIVGSFNSDAAKLLLELFLEPEAVDDTENKWITVTVIAFSWYPPVNGRKQIWIPF